MYEVLGIFNVPGKGAKENAILFVIDRINKKDVRLAQYVIRPYILKSVGSNSGQVMFHLTELFSTSVT